MSVVSIPFENHEDELDRVFHALSDRTRRAILARLSRGPAVIKELAEPFNMTFAAVSKHLRVLEDAKLVRRRVDGKFHRCALSAAPMQDANRWLLEYRRFWESSLDSFAEYVTEMEGKQP